MRALLAGLAVALLSATPVSTSQKGKQQETPIGRTGQQYIFEYQSALEKKLRTYRVRNTPGGVLTPVLWEGNGDTFVKTHLAKKDKNEKDDAWLVFKQPGGSPELGKTSLQYGVNMDEFKDSPDAYRRKLNVSTSGSPDDDEPLETSIKGRVADADGKTYPVDITVRCRVADIKGQPNIVYTIEQRERDTPTYLAEGRMGKTAQDGEVIVHWKSASQAFMKPPPEVAKVMPARIRSDKDALEISIPWRYGITLVNGMLELRAHGKLIAATTAPAYVPKGK